MVKALMMHLIIILLTIILSNIVYKKRELMYICKNKEYLHLMNSLIKIPKEISDCNYDIYFFNKGFC